MKLLKKFDAYPVPDKKPVTTIDNKYCLQRVSRWISVKTNYNPNKNNTLWDYVTDENGASPYNENFKPENGLFLDYFRYNGCNYATRQFLGIGSIADQLGHQMGYIENGEKHFIAGYDSCDYWHPLYIELSADGEHVRLYRAVSYVNNNRGAVDFIKD